MEEEEHTDRMQQLAMLCQKLNKIKSRLNEDDTDNINNIISSHAPETCLNYLKDFEKRGDPNLDCNHLTKLLDFYSRVFSDMPLGKYCHNESYAKMLVRFAELKAIQDGSEAEANFNVARSHCQDFAFVHIAHAQFELAHGNTDKGTLILQKAIELNVKPRDQLLAALHSLQSGKRKLFLTEDKENIPEMCKASRISDGTGDLSRSSAPGTEPRSAPLQDHIPGWRSGSQLKKTGVMPPVISPEPRPWEHMGMVDSTTSLLHRPVKRDPSRMEDTTDSIQDVISSMSPEACWMHLVNMEKRGNPHADNALRSKLMDCYSKVFSRLPIGKYSKNESYARMLVRYAELSGIEDPDDARDNFIIARSNSKAYAFVHIAHAQFEVSQGNVQKGASILQKAQGLSAKPAEHLELAMCNLKAGKTPLLPVDVAKSCPPGTQPQRGVSVAAHGGEKQHMIPTRIPDQEQPKPASREPLSAWKMPSRVSRVVSPEEKHTPDDPRPVPRQVDSFPTPSLALPSRLNMPSVCQTPNNNNNKYSSVNSYVTPLAKRDPPVVMPQATKHRLDPAQQPCTPLNQVAYAQTPQASISSISNESITIKGRQFFILKKIGQGGSSKVYQVLDHKKQLFAVKYVDLEEADAPTIESYKNEIKHLNHLQQYSDQIIKLYDYEITSHSIYMLMECGNLDLNTWLRNRKSVNQLERKFYWKNMLDAVSTIHKHGIVHSDLKPANFVIVNASLKLIDFGISNRIQPEVTSIMKDSMMGTLNYMPPEAIHDTSSKPGKASSKISPKGDVWSLGCILYCMTYGKTPFQSITNCSIKMHAIIDPSHEIEFPDIPEKDLLDVLKRTLVRNPRERISIAELLDHPYLQLQTQPAPEPTPLDNSDLKRILNELAALQSPNSIVRAASNLAKMCNTGRKLDVSECVKTSSLPSWNEAQ
ncbi:dual specificity protein kinase Ttk [Aplochiton taeniatus]